MPEYPDRLLPSNEDEIIDDIEDNHYIARFHDASKFSAFKEDGSFNSGVIDFYRIPGLSSNLVPPSELSDLKIKITNPDLHEDPEWEPGKEVPNINEEDFEINENREVYYFQAKDIRVSVNYQFKGEEFTISIDVKHVPLIYNISHCEFIVPDTRRDNPERKFSSSKDRHNLLEYELKLALEESVIKHT